MNTTGLGDNYARFLFGGTVAAHCQRAKPEPEHQREGSGHRRIQLRRDRRFHRRLGTSGRLHAASSAAVGTYVGLRGGNRYPTMIRKLRTKAASHFPPGRLQRSEYLWWGLVDGESGDGTSVGFAGYEVNHVLGRRRAIMASARHGHFPGGLALAVEGLADAPVKASRVPRVAGHPIPGEGWQVVSEGYKFTEGPAANAKGRCTSMMSVPARPTKSGSRARCTEFPEDSKKGRRPGVRAGGRLYVGGGRGARKSWLMTRRQPDGDRQRIPGE